MASGYKNPPKFDEDTYDNWKNELEIWRLVTDLAPEKQALAVTLSLSGKAREAAVSVKADDLNKEDGISTLLSKLDTIFKRDTIDCAYEAYTNFENFKKTDQSKSMSDFILEFDQKYQKTKSFDMALPDAVLAFKLLESANLSTQERQLALTACTDMKYQSMKSTLKRIFGESSSSTRGNDEPIRIKQESAFYTDQRRFSGFRGTSGGRPRQQFSSFNSAGATAGASKMRGTNPRDKFGRPSKCKICFSVFHWWKDCPNKSESVNMAEDRGYDRDMTNVEECNITLFTSANEDISKQTVESVFAVESKNAAVIDTACTRTVCGEKWLDNYLESIKDTSTVQSVYSKKPFRFGDGNIVYSFRKVSLPANIGDTNCNIDVEVVKADIPLLLSKTSLKKAGTVLDLQNDQATMFNKPVVLQFTSSGHYCIDLTGGDMVPEAEVENDSQIVLMIDSQLDEKEKINMSRKLHKQFGHASSEKLINLLKKAGNTDKDIFKCIEKVVSECVTCQRYKKPAPRPVVCFPRATDHNQTVAMDLHQLEASLWYLHIMDEFSRFSAGCITHTKQASKIVSLFMKYWISVHGAPKRILSDNGGEFDNSEFREMAEEFNIELVTTPAYSPWSNGMLERHNQTLTDMLLKVKSDKSVDWDTALSWALMAKNSLHGVDGFSPQQLVFARNPNLPSILVDAPPALEGTTTSQTVGEHIAALYATRKAFTQAECSERIRRALRKQTRPTPDFCETGHKVYYKRPNCQEWKGPATVIGQDGPVIFVRHGGMVVRVHKCRMSKIDEHGSLESRQTDPNPEDNGEKALENNVQCDESDSEDDCDKKTSEGQVAPRNEPLKVKPGHIVKYKHQETDDNIVARVISRAGKAKGPLKHWFNVQCLNPANIQGAEFSVDLGKVEDLEINNQVPESQDCEDVMVTTDVDMNKAKLAEIENWKQNEVFIEVEDKGQRTVSTRWVCTLKTTPSGITPKARLVARGFEEFTEDLQKDSPTCGHESMRVILAILAQRTWRLHSMDIKTAFLQGEVMDRTVYIKPPKEANCSGKVWQLKKCVYGLSDASLHWYKRVKAVMTECGGLVSKVDPSVFYWRDKNGAVIGILACHVDDFIWGGAPEFENTIDHIRKTFKVGKENEDQFEFCGINLMCSGGNIYLSQDKYAENLNNIKMDPNRAAEKDSDLTEGEKSLLRSKVGQLLWLAHQGRPDLLFDVTVLATNVKHGKVKHMQMANKIMTKAKGSGLSLKFQQLGPSECLQFVVFSDASLGNLADGGSQGGYLVLLVGESGRFSPIWWNSRKIRRVVRSTLAAETLSLSEGVDMAIFIATLFSELMCGGTNKLNVPLVCVTDCKSLFEAVKSQKFVSEKRLRIEISGLKEMLENGQIKNVQWCETQKQMADCLTKCGASTYELRKILQSGIVDINMF